MLVNVRDLLGYEVISSDRALGRVSGLWIDDRNWEVRLVSVDGGETARDQVQVSPAQPGHFDPVRRVLQIEASQSSGTPARDPAGVGLTNSQDVIGCDLQAKDGRAGHVADLLVDATAWRAVYLVVDTRDWWLERDVLLNPRCVTEMDREAKILRVNLNRDAVKRSPPWQPKAGFSPDDDLRIANYFGVPPLD